MGDGTTRVYEQTTYHITDESGKEKQNANGLVCNNELNMTGLDSLILTSWDSRSFDQPVLSLTVASHMPGRQRAVTLDLEENGT